MKTKIKSKTKYMIICLIIFLTLFLVSFYLNPSSVGVTGYYQYCIGMLLCLIAGLPLFCFTGILSFVAIGGFLQTIINLFRKKKSMKRILREFKSEFSFVLIILGSFLVTILPTWFGINGFIAVIKDKPYIEKPEKVVLTNWRVETRGSYFVGYLPRNTRLIGKDSDEKDYNFLINRDIKNNVYPHYEFSKEENLYVYYLPNTNIVMKIE